ncbi:MAG: pyrroline-5-carboxylate reductase [Nitrospinae bacterium]|nr:pyrroline-5-carboxylate reductase [Nitrospinota bacterium]
MWSPWKKAPPIFGLERGFLVNGKLKNRKVGFIGGGAMGEAVIAGLLKAGICPAEAVMASDASSARLDHLKARYGIAVTKDNMAVVSRSDALVLAVKPQVMPDVLREVGHSIHDDVVVISIAAGVRIATLMQFIKARLVRAMPNICATAGEGVTALVSTPRVEDGDRAVAEELFGAVGSVLWVEESKMDAVTALSGSGPAYVFLMMEALMQAGVENGLTQEQARALVYQTVKGAAALAMEGEHPAVLREKVTSPGGTTAAALHELEAHGVRAAFMAAVSAAVRRSKELG